MSQVRSARGAAARLCGRRGEARAAAWLMLKGYRILGFRLATPMAKIDLLALRGKLLSVVEVQQRRTLEEALEAVRTDQRERLRRAGAHIAAMRPALSNVAVRLDLIALAPGRAPRHIPDAWAGA
ncbi:YraN family protein [Caulobacter segnis]|uniref:YraN family protein n=1 Tax=Caulobacter segnis TaxID=88688 RepID=UPI00241019D2|nr:YraN family protein [Caulobacter segnis]MDG2521426.1 YraN family protein [Caulobacter segnis]